MSPYANCLTLAIFLAYMTWTMQALKKGWISSPWRSPVLLMMIAGFVGARSLAVLAEYELYADKAFTGDGPMAIQGAMAGFALVGVLFARWRKIPVAEMLDAVALALAFMVPCIRVGCFLAGCCFGTTCTHAWAVADPGGAPVHPTQLYEVALGVVIIGLLMRQGAARAGTRAITFLLVYGVGRASIECLRNDTERLFSGLVTYPQLIAIAMLIAGLTWRHALKGQSDAAIDATQLQPCTLPGTMN